MFNEEARGYMLPKKEKLHSLRKQTGAVAEKVVTLKMKHEPHAR